MRILIVGQGGREHALAWKIAASPLVDQVVCAPGNAGTENDCANIDIAAGDIERLIRFAKSENIGLTIVGPEAPLVDGVVDAFEQEGLRIFGPSRAAAELEGSKSFAKSLMKQANVPTADFRAFDDPDDAVRFINDREVQQVVVKADGLAAGKGVTVCKTREQAIAAINAAMVDEAFGAAGGRIVIEEFLSGQEASILAIVDGSTILPLEPSQDHKPAFDDDKGPNTGGMGAYCPTPIVTQEGLDQIIERILVPTVHTLKKEGKRFRGVLYAGLMFTPQGPRVLEYNVRFGDPEIQPVLMRLKTDLVEVILAALDGRLSVLPPLEWDPRPAVCVVMAADGYPAAYEKGHVIRGIEDADRLPDVKVFHAGTARHGEQTVTDGGRVLGVTALGESIPDAKRRAYQAVKCIRWEGAWCRKDISDKAR